MLLKARQGCADVHDELLLAAMTDADLLAAEAIETISAASVGLDSSPTGSAKPIKVPCQLGYWWWHWWGSKQCPFLLHMQGHVWRLESVKQLLQGQPDR